MKFIVSGVQTNFIEVEVEAETPQDAKMKAWQGNYLNKNVTEGEETFDEVRQIK